MGTTEEVSVKKKSKKDACIGECLYELNKLRADCAVSSEERRIIFDIFGLNRSKASDSISIILRSCIIFISGKTDFLSKICPIS